MNKKTTMLCVLAALLILTAASYFRKSNAESPLSSVFSDDNDSNNNNIFALQTGQSDRQLLSQQQTPEHEQSGTNEILERGGRSNDNDHIQDDGSSSNLLSGNIANLVLIGTIVVIVSVSGYASYNLLKIKEKSLKLKRISNNNNLNPGSRV